MTGSPKLTTTAFCATAALLCACDKEGARTHIELPGNQTCEEHDGFFLRSAAHLWTGATVEVLETQNSEVVNEFPLEKDPFALTGISEARTFVYLTGLARSPSSSDEAAMEMRVVDLSAGTERPLPTELDGNELLMRPWVELSPNGDLVAVVAAKSWGRSSRRMQLGLFLVDVWRGEPAEELCMLDLPISKPDWDRDGAAVYILSGKDILQVGTSQRSVTRVGENVGGAPYAIDSSGRGILVHTEQGDVFYAGRAPLLSDGTDDRTRLPLYCGRPYGLDDSGHLYYTALRNDSQEGSSFPGLTYPAGGLVVRCYNVNDKCSRAGHVVFQDYSQSWKPVAFSRHSGL